METFVEEGADSFESETIYSHDSTLGFFACEICGKVFFSRDPGAPYFHGFFAFHECDCLSYFIEWAYGDPSLFNPSHDAFIVTFMSGEEFSAQGGESIFCNHRGCEFGFSDFD